MTVRKGDFIRCREDIKTNGLIHWRAPFTGGGACTIPAGTILVVDVDPPSGAAGFSCLPRNYRDFETKHVPSQKRRSAGYDGYSFVLSLADIGRRLEVITSEGERCLSRETAPRSPSKADSGRHRPVSLVHRALAPLASLEVQKRYIHKRTKDDYLLPEDLLNTAINVLFEQQAVRLDETGTLEELREAIRACNIPEGLSNSEMIFSYEPWIKVREKSRQYLLEAGFDLEAWERLEK
jgi:hypothetical protein